MNSRKGAFATDLETEKAGSGAFEKFLFIATPILFTLVLLGVLLALFDTNVMNGVLRFAHKIPVVQNWVPEPKDSKVTLASEEAGKTMQAQLDADAVAAWKAKIAQAEAELQTALQTGEKKEATIAELQTQIEQLQEQLQEKRQSDETYALQIRQLSSMYAGMMPSKAAPVLEALTLKERALVLSEMKQEERSKILEKMSPKVAAETSIQLKDQVLAKDLQLAALQERLDIQQAGPAKAAQPVKKDDVGATFANMVPKSAATILIEMYSANADGVLDIMKTMEVAARAKVLAAISDSNKQVAAAIAAKLGS